jgi:hypothetical protein
LVAAIIIIALAFLAAATGHMQSGATFSSGGCERRNLSIGTVSNASARALLASAVVEIEMFGLSTTTDAAGQFRFRNLPPGEHTVSASYSGLNRTRLTVLVSAGTMATAEISLRSELYVLDAVVAILIVAAAGG